MKIYTDCASLLLCGISLKFLSQEKKETCSEVGSCKLDVKTSCVIARVNLFTGFKITLQAILNPVNNEYAGLKFK